jgi:hypothetical protein
MKAITVATTVEDTEILRIHSDRTEIYDFAREYPILTFNPYPANVENRVSS